MKFKTFFRRNKPASPVPATSAIAPNTAADNKAAPETRGACATQTSCGEAGRKVPISLPATTASLSARIWNDAYEGIQSTYPELVAEYEIVLSTILGGPGFSAVTHSGHGPISNDREERADQMRQLVQKGLERSRAQMDIAENVSEGIRAIFAVRGTIDTAVQACPQAAVAWAGICFALELFTNPGEQAQSNRNGIAYVLFNLEWYWQLSELLLDENILPSQRGLRTELEKHMIELYKLLLLFQMRSAHRYYRPRSTFVRDLVKWDDWDSKLAEIKLAERDLQQKSDAYNSENIKMRLTDIATYGRQQAEDLTHIRDLVSNQTTLQLDEQDRQCRFELFGGIGDGARDRITSQQGHPLQSVCDWIFTNNVYQQWAEKDGPRLLWIYGDPGQGKTMLLCSIIDQMEMQSSNKAPPAFFFCQASDVEISKKASVLLGLIALMTEKQPLLMRHVRAVYDKFGPKNFQGSSAWQPATKIFTQILDDPSLQCDTILIDALDECVDKRDRADLIRFIIDQSSRVKRVKWLVSSRKWPEIEKLMKGSQQLIHLHLDPTNASIVHALDLYIDQKVKELSELHEYDAQTAKIIKDQLRQRANGTFLWVAIACQQLGDVASWEALETLHNIPQDLEDVYQSMLKQIDAAHIKVSRAILAHALLAQRPLHQEELRALVEELESVPLHGLQEVVARCRSFLTIRSNVLCWIHQSAREYLQSHGMRPNIFPDGDMAIVHYAIVSRSFDLMNRALHRDMYDVVEASTLITSIKIPYPDPLLPHAYSCVYWAHHLQECKSRFLANSESHVRLKIEKFMTTKFLYWVEAMCLLHSIPQCIIAIGDLRVLVQESAAWPLLDFIQDAHRFLRYHADCIRAAPLQIYSSALLFSPVNSHIRKFFEHEEPSWPLKPVTSRNWDACVQTLEGHGDGVTAVAFSPQGSLIASGSSDWTVRLWDAASGRERRQLYGHQNGVTDIVFSSDGSVLASASRDGTIRLWSPSSGRELRKLEGHSSGVSSVAFCPIGSVLASASEDQTIRLWDTDTGLEVRTIHGHSSWVSAVAFSPDGSTIASASADKSVRLWDKVAGLEMRRLEGHDASVSTVAFSPDGSTVVSASRDQTIRQWDVLSGRVVRILSGHSAWVTEAVYLPDGLSIASSSVDQTVRLWNAETGHQIRVLEGHQFWVSALACSPDGLVIASASADSSLRLWDACCPQEIKREQRQRNPVSTVICSPDGSLVATASYDQIVLWDVSTGQETQKIEHDYGVHALAFSPTGSIIASACGDYTVRLWSSSTGELMQRIQMESLVPSIAFSEDGRVLETEAGSFVVDRELPLPQIKESHSLPNHGFSVSHQWVRHQGKNLLWLPVDYRASCWASCGKVLAIGRDSGLITILEPTED